MWNMHRFVSADSDELAQSTTELITETFRSMIVVVGALYLAWFLYASAAWVPGPAGWNAWLITPPFVAIVACTGWLLPRRLWLAQVVWLAGLAVHITFALLVFQRPEMTFCYGLLSLVAVVTLGWPFGLLVELLLCLLLAALTRWQTITIGYAAATVAAGITTGAQALALHGLVTLLGEWHGEGHVHENYNAETGDGDDTHMSAPGYTCGAVLGYIATQEVADCEPWAGWRFGDLSNEGATLGNLRSPFAHLWNRNCELTGASGHSRGLVAVGIATAFLSTLIRSGVQILLTFSLHCGV